MYWLPKIHKRPTGARFIVAFRKCSTKALSNASTKSFELIFKQIQSFHKKSHFTSFKPVTDRMNQINTKQILRLISTSDFSTLNDYTKTW